ncbi:hypothetical protein DFQ26_002570 [Actinomortierella ambigua]|nr:hypothetical protein DFQ26_002570 [Actinomortierella ambigua]
MVSPPAVHQASSELPSVSWMLNTSLVPDPLETAARDQFWSRLQETEQEKEQAHKSLSTLKKQAYQRFDAIQDLTAARREDMPGDTQKNSLHVTGETDRGRRVDLLLCCEDLEILNSEAKFNESGLACERQYNKNLRINKAIWNIARRRGIRLLAMYPLDI